MRLFWLTVVLVTMLSTCRPFGLVGNAIAAELAAPPNLESVLDQRVSVDFQDTPLTDVVEFLRKQTNINVMLDKKSLEDVGISDDAPVTLRLRNLPLRSALSIAMRPLGLAWTIRDDVLMLTTPESAESELQTEIFPIRDLVAVDGVWDESKADYASLIDLITYSVAPTSWSAFGGPSEIQAYQGMLIVSQTPDVRHEIRQRLADLRAAAAVAREHADRPPPQVVVRGGGVAIAEAKIEAALAKPTTMDFNDLPLTDFVAWISEQTGVQLLIDSNSLDAIGLATDIPISISAKNLPLRFGLRLALDPHDLSYTIRDGVLEITGLDESERADIVRVYPVADLLGQPAEAEEFAEENFGPDFYSLIALITATIEPDSWDEVGGPGSIESFLPSHALVIAQTLETHEQIELLLARMRTTLATEKTAAKQAAVAQPAVPPTVVEKPELRLNVYFLPTPKPPAPKPEPNKQSQAPAGGSPAVLALFGGAWSMPVNPGEPVIGEQELLAVIQELIEPESWEQPGVYAKAVTGRLIIRHTDATHRKITNLLVKLGVYGPRMGGMGAIPVVGSSPATPIRR